MTCSNAKSVRNLHVAKHKYQQIYVHIFFYKLLFNIFYCFKLNYIKKKENEKLLNICLFFKR